MKYKTEKEGQKAFFERFGVPFREGHPLIESPQGVFNGIFYLFKLEIKSIDDELKEAFRYLHQLKESGGKVPATILLVDLNAKTAYEYTGYAVQVYDYTDLVESNWLRHKIRDKKSEAEMYTWL